MKSFTIDKAKKDKLEKALKEVVKEDAIEFIKKEFPTLGKIRLDIRPLWGRCYRLNFWERNKAEDNIIKSYFIEVCVSKKGFEIKNYDKKDVEKN